MDDEATHRRRRVGLAGHRGDAATARSHLTDPAAAVRTSALRAVQRADRLDESELRSALGDPDPGVRIAALELAATTDAPPVHPLLDDPDPRVAETAAWVCGERGGLAGAVIERLSEMARHHRDALCRESAVAALGALGDRVGLAAVLAALDDKPAIRRRAVVALAAFEGAEVEAALVRARSDHDRQVREAVEELIGPA